MPYNIFGEEYHDDCGCSGCRYGRANRDYVNGDSYDTPDQARQAMRQWTRLHGHGPMAEHTPGLRRHREPPWQPPDFIGLRSTRSDRHFDEAEIGQPMSSAVRREVRAMAFAREEGWSFEPVTYPPPPPPPSPLQREVRRMPHQDPRHNYSYRPTEWNYFGKGPSYYGLEFEIRCGSLQVMQYALRRVGEQLCHLKNDSSIGGGFELVTHPMDYGYAISNFPWDLLPELEELGCIIAPETNGLHVHVGRDGFASGGHVLRFLKLLYRNKPQVIRISRRETGRYGGFDANVQAGQVVHVKAEKARERLKGAEERYRHCPCKMHEDEYGAASRELEDLLRGDTTRKDRYQAVNTRNPTTLELRMFASTLGVLEAKAALQLAAAAVEYTRKLTAADVCAGGWRWIAFSAWLREHEATYPELVHANAHARMPRRPTAKFVMAKEPRRGI